MRGDTAALAVCIKFLHCFHTCVMHNVAGATHEIYGEVFSKTLVRMEFLFPKLTDVFFYKVTSLPCPGLR